MEDNRILGEGQRLSSTVSAFFDVSHLRLCILGLEMDV
jgi:hypothetical protein